MSDDTVVGSIAFGPVSDKDAIDAATGTPGLGEAFERTSIQMASAIRACQGLTLPADVAPGAVARLVEAAETLYLMEERTARDSLKTWDGKQFIFNDAVWAEEDEEGYTAATALRAALSALGREV